MESSRPDVYSIPAKYRRMENMHIVFWLMKDISWCLFWEELAIAMVIPTLVIAVIIAHRTRRIKSELAHNLAIAFWIAANSLWMVSEFFHFDSMAVWLHFTGKHLALIPFVIGLLFLVYYYVFQRAREIREHHEVTM